MFIVGLTGGIGSGKSTVANIFESLGATIIDTDVISHQLIQKGQPGYRPILEKFGNQIINPDGQINRKLLGNIIFNDFNLKSELENILHPLIWDEVYRLGNSSTAPYVIIVVPLLFETNTRDIFNRILVVDADIEQQKSRVKKRDNRTESEIENIIKQQLPRERRLKQADDIIENTQSISDLRNKVRSLHEKYLSLSQ